MPDDRVRIFVVWERVIPTDWGPPETATLALIRDPRAAQYWDPGRALSKRLGERPGERNSIVWDWVAIYEPGRRWQASPPQPLYQDRPVVDVADTFRARLQESLSR